jgi:predicted transcriptional regulator
MSNARASKTIRLIEFVLWFENLLRNIFRNERSKIVKEFDFYQTKNQHELNIFLRKCMQIFEIRLVIYRRDLDRVQYAQMWFTDDIFDVWYRKYELMNENLFWKLFKETLQEHFASQRFRIINVEQKLKKFKQRLKQFVSQLCAHLNSLKNQFSKRFHENQRASHLFFALHSYIRDAIIRKHENCTTRIQIEKTVLLIERIESNFDMSNRYRCKTFQNLNRSRFQITINRFFARASLRCLNSVEREREYSSVLNESNRKFQTSIRFNRVDQITQKWRNFVARFSNASHQRISLSSKRKNEVICYNCDKQDHVQSKCLISFNKTSLKYAKKDRDLWALSSSCKLESKETTLSITFS